LPGSVTIRGKLLTLVSLLPSGIIWYRSVGGSFAPGKVGLASRWPCVTDFSDLTTYGIKAYGREMNIPPTLHWGVWHTLFLLRIVVLVGLKASQDRRLGLGLF